MATGEGAHKVVVDLDTFIKEVYDHLGHSWKFLARELGFSETDVAALEHDNQFSLKEQIHQMFYQWRRREGDGATSDKLLAAMKSAGFDEQIRILTGKGMIENEKSSADLASSLAAGVRLPIQASDDTQVQTDSPVRPKLMATNAPSPSSDDVRSDGPFRSKTAPAGSTSTSSPREKELTATRSSKASPTASTPPSERDFIRQQRLKRFSSSTSDRSDTNSASCSEQRVLDSPPREVADNVRPLSVRTSSATTETSTPSAATFEVGDCIRVERPDSAPWYGVIRWIGTLPGTSTAPLAGMEMEHVVKGGGDGSIAGVQHFTCADGHGLFLPLSRLKRDDRFDNAGEVESSESSPRVERSTNPVSDPLSDLMSRLWTAGENRGTEQSAPSDSEPGGSKVYELRIPADRAGLVIGAGGKNIREVERLTNTSINVDGGGLGIYGGGNRKVRVLGSEENCKKALLLILKKVEHRVDEHMAGVKTISVPDRCVGRIIGKGGATISTIKSLSGAHDIKFDDRKTGLEAMLQTERQCYIHGSEEAIQKAERLIRLAVDGEDVVAGATFAAIFMELLKLGVQCQEEEN